MPAYRECPLSKQQLSLHGSSQKRAKVSLKAASDFVKGETDLVSALKVQDASIEGLRAQAVALYESARFQRAIDILLAVNELARLRPEELLILSISYKKLGDKRRASMFAALAQDALEEVDEILLRQQREAQQ